jgi:DNA mismatch endonuclease (patch repair protein)
MDKLSPERRSENMRRIRNKNTKPEMVVRRLIYSLGYRYRIHQKQLPGKPDLVFTKRRKIILIHGCFWHLHSECREGRIPNSRKDYWLPKLTKNVNRDTDNLTKLNAAGWEVMVIWECQLSNLKELAENVKSFLNT